MKKTIIFFSALSFSISSAQLSKIEQLDNTYNQKFKEISEKYEKVYNVERKKEEVKIIMDRLEGYELAIKVIQKEEPKVDVMHFQNYFTTPPEYEIGINGFRGLVAQHFNTSAVTLEDGIVRTMARFLVDEQGNISNITAIGDYREFNLLTTIALYEIRNEGKWKPAEKDGIPVPSVLAVPITMKFE
ncbi:hypothetical protein [Kaistella sp.]|uniref:hypothetical protein n=1 Tax=Kaistella sp. TaxID=2782235 RepID=UPI003C4A8042